MTKAEKIKYLLFPAIGFGIAGGLWGLFDILGSLEGIGIMLIIIVLIVNSFLISFSKDINFFKKTLIILGGSLIWIIAFILWALGFVFFGLPDSLPLESIYYNILLFLLFFCLGPIMIGLFYVLVLRLVLKIKIWPVLWRALVGFILAFLAGLSLTKLIGSILSPALGGIILGLFVGWGLYRGQKPK